ncbi:MAG: NnrS family protein [Alphaproteobacteria bacterium]|nr:NnrS family protein [Alphaproteobacteria bacterium]
MADPGARQNRLALMDSGFRAFFLLAGIDAIANMGLWLAAYFHPSLWPEGAIPAMYWHAHEMLFGFAGTTIGGFLLTAIPNWTGRGPYRGPALWLLVGIWILGRLAMLPFFSLPASLATAASILFFPALGLTIAPALLRARSFRNLPFLALLLLLSLADLCFQGRFGTTAQLGEHIGLYAGLDVILIMIAIVGGRIVANFTRGVLRQRGASAKIASHPWIERGAAVSLLAMVAWDMVMPLSRASGAATLVAALIQVLRFGQWKGPRTDQAPFSGYSTLAMAGWWWP